MHITTMRRVFLAHSSASTQGFFDKLINVHFVNKYKLHNLVQVCDGYSKMFRG